MTPRAPAFSKVSQRCDAGHCHWLPMTPLIASKHPAAAQRRDEVSLPMSMALLILMAAASTQHTAAAQRHLLMTLTMAQASRDLVVSELCE